MTTSHHRRLVLLLLLMLAMAGCTNLQGVGQVAGAVTQAESFNFKFLRLLKGADGKYSLMLPFTDYSNECRATSFAETELIDTFKTGIYRRLVGVTNEGGIPTPQWVNVTFTFDRLAACNTPGEVHYETADLVVPVTDANGNVTYHHPHGIDADLSGGGVLVINIIDDHFHVYNPAQVKATGPMTLDRIELPGGPLGGASGDTYTTANIVNPFFVFNLTGILVNPGRVTGDFAFSAKKAPNDDDLLVVWDGDFVLRTDI